MSTDITIAFHTTGTVAYREPWLGIAVASGCGPTIRTSLSNARDLQITVIAIIVPSILT